MPDADLYMRLLRNAAEANKSLGSTGAYFSSEDLVPWTMLTPEDIRRLASNGQSSYHRPAGPDIQELPRVTPSSPRDRGLPSIVQSPHQPAVAAPPAVLPIHRRSALIARAVARARDEKAFLDAMRTGKFAERELASLEREFHNVHGRKPRRR